MSRRTATPLFSFETPSRRGNSPSRRRSNSSNRSREPTARELLDSIVQTSDNPTRETPRKTPPVSSVTDENIERREAQDTSVTSAIKHLREHQKKLQASSNRIEEMLKQLTETQKVNEATATKHIPRALSRIIHDVYEGLVDEESEMKWNLLESFDHVSNHQINTTLVRNVQGVLKDNEYNPSMIKRAARTYFKSKKSDYYREQSGKKASTAASSRKRQQRHNKARARLRILNLSKNIDEATKKKVEPVLKADYMSSEDSELEDVTVEQGQSSGSELEDIEPIKKKRLIKHKPPWRSREMQLVIESLDRKMDRRRDARAKNMCLEHVVGPDSMRPKPDGLPDWATELFS